MRLSIVKNSPVTITKWKMIGFAMVDRTRAEWVKQGVVLDAVGNTVKVKFSLRILFIKFYYCKWFSFADQQYTINVKNSEKIV